VVAAAAIGGAFIVWRHKENIRRLRAGTESKLSLGGRRA
jgi:glycerol-3-phosphate acyltransferase PlsY